MILTTDPGRHPRAACGRLLAITLVFSLVTAGWALAAGSPFEIEINELEREGKAPKPDKAKPARPSGKRPSRGRSAPRPQTGTPTEGGEYLRYTIRPGDHIFKVLTTRFGMSSAQAEAVIPHIVRLNGISDIARLQVGQTILIPAAGRKPEAQPATAALPPSAPAAGGGQSAAPVPRPLQPGAGLKGIQALWLKLFPERGPKAGELGEKAVGPVTYPALTGADGREIVIAPAEAPPVFANLSGARTEERAAVVIVPEGDKRFAAEVLKAAGFDTYRENHPLVIGLDPKVTVTADFLVSRKTPGREAPESILIAWGEKGCRPVSDALARFLAEKGLRLVDLCAGAADGSTYPRVIPLGVSAIDAAGMTDRMLDVLSLKWSKSHQLKMVVGRDGGVPLTVTVDRYFEVQGNRYFIDFSGTDPNHVTLARLLELAGYRKIVIDPREGFRSIGDKLLAAAGLKSDYRKQALTAPGGRVRVELSGFLITRPGREGERLLVIDAPLEKTLADLIAAGTWDMN